MTMNIGKLHSMESGISDMTNLVELSDNSLLNNLKVRYNERLIYTYIGSILISINPYKELGIYDEKHIKSYKGRTIAEMPPHIFGIGETTYTKLMQENENQVIVISGESGSGKTEVFKRILKYLAYSSGSLHNYNPEQLNKIMSDSVSKKVLDSTPLLESFGNAKTIRNDNSSRFGKYVEVFFDGGKICGSRITNYLLEKSRIVKINPDERGYHIFYEVLSGLDNYGKSQYYLKDVQDYKYINRSSSYLVEDKNDSQDFTDLMQQWNTLGLTDEDLDVTMRILSTVLHLGNIEFGSDENDMCRLTETENLKIVSKLLKVDLDVLKICFTMKTITTSNESTLSPITKEQAENYRDTLAKHLYTEMFNWIIEKVNESLNRNSITIRRSPSHLDRSLNSASSMFRSISMLDIYGFENFPENSLEQLCINFANETLQQFFNKYVFELEQAEYQNEGISWHYIKYPDNQPIIDMLSAKPSGIIQILNDECSIPQGSDESFITKSYNVHKKSPHFQKPNRQHPPQFIIRHFAGEINYIASGFVEKNRDILRKEMMEMIENSRVPEISKMFVKKRQKLTKNPVNKARTPAVMADFQYSLTLLLSKMKTSQPWFIRCLKPNNDKLALTFDSGMVMEQMKYTGILETVKIRKSGFPIRIVFSVFLSRFYLLQNSKDKAQARSDAKAVCHTMMKRFGGEQSNHFETGRTKLFLREKFARHLETQVRVIQDHCARIIQAKWRKYWKVRVIERMNESATKIQAIVRGFLERRRINRFKQAIVKLQSLVRMQIVRKKFLEEHPEFLRYVHLREDEGPSSKSVTNYKFPKTVVRPNSKPQKQVRQYENLKIPIELAFLLDKARKNYGSGHCISRESQIRPSGRAQHLWNRNDHQLPPDIDYYPMEYYLQDWGNQFSLEPKNKPLQQPFLKMSFEDEDTKEKCLNAHKLILRLLHVQSMPWMFHYLTGSFLAHLATQSKEIQNEIWIQLISETMKRPGAMDNSAYWMKGEKRRYKVAWTLLGNLLSYVIPNKDIFFYVLKHISDTSSNDQAVTCQEKMLYILSSETLPIPRLFPASNLEWRANSMGYKTALNIHFYDNVSNSVHVSSYSKAEDVASHSLCFRLNRYRLLKGWSISIVYEKCVIDVSGSGYVFDVISGKELPQVWADISGKSFNNHFFTSQGHPKSFSSWNNAPKIKNQAPLPLGYQKIKDNRRHKHSATSLADSHFSTDQFVDNLFGDTIQSNNGGSLSGIIHGLKDELPPNKVLVKKEQAPLPPGQPQAQFEYNAQGQMMQEQVYPPPGYLRIPQYTGSTASPFAVYNPQTQALQEQLNMVQLENKIIESNIEKEMLRNRYQQMAGYNNNLPYTSQTTTFVPPQPTVAPQMSSHYYQEISTNEISDIRVKTNQKTRAPPPPPPPPPMVPNGIENGIENGFSEINGRQASQPSIVKYSRVGPASQEVVDDTTVLPDIDYDKPTKKISELRAAEMPKVNIANRTAFLEQFFKDKNETNIPKTPESRGLRRTTVTQITEPSMPPPVNINNQISVHEELADESLDVSRNTNKSRRKDVLFPRPIVLGNGFQENGVILQNGSTETYSHHTKPPTQHKAIILSGIPDIRYFSYTNEVPWKAMIRKEIYLGRDIQDSTILNTNVFCQIVSDLIQYPCMRWVENEREQLLSILGEYGEVFDVDRLKRAPKDLIVQIIDEAQKCQLYFSRFYPIKMKSHQPSSMDAQMWLAISHSGVRFVEQDLTSDSSHGLQILRHITYREIEKLISKQPDERGMPQILNIHTRKDKVKILSEKIQSIHDLILEFKDQQEGNTIRSMNSSMYNGSSSERTKHSHKSHKKNRHDREFDRQTVIYSATKERIAVPNDISPSRGDTLKSLYNYSSNSNTSRRKRSPNLIDFMIIYSKYKNKHEIVKSILLFKKEPITEPFLSGFSQFQIQNILNINKMLISMSQSSSNYAEIAEKIAEIGTSDRDLVDEIILQIFKQLNGNNNKICSKGLWSLLKIVILYIGPSERIKPFLRNQFQQLVKNTESPYYKQINDAKECLHSVELHGMRKMKPSKIELQQIMKNVIEGTYTVYGMKKSILIMVHFNRTIHDILVYICSTFQVTLANEVNEFSLALNYIDREGVQRTSYLKPSQYFYDILNGLIDQNIEKANFYFNRTSWMSHLFSDWDITRDRTETFIELMYIQLVKDCFNGRHMLPVSGAAITNDYIMLILETIKFIFCGDDNSQGYTRITQEYLDENISPVVLQILKQQNIDPLEIINRNLSDEPHELATIHYKKNFLVNLEEKFPNFGQLEFPISLMNHSYSSPNDFAVFDRKGIIIQDINGQSKFKIKLSDLIGYQVKVLSNQPNFELTYRANKNQQNVVFTTSKVTEIEFMLNHYLNYKNILRQLNA